MIELMNHVAQVWWDWMSAMFWQVGLLIILIAIIDLLIRKWAWPQLRYALWSLILVKLVLSPTLSLPSALTPKLKPVVTQMLESAAKEELIEMKLPIVIPTAEDTFHQPVVRSYPTHPAIVEMESNIIWSAPERGPTHFQTQPAPIPAETSTDISIRHEQSKNTTADTPVLVSRSPENMALTLVGPRLDWRFYAMAVWFLGVVTLGTWLFVKLRRLQKEKPNGSRKHSLPESFYDQLDRCAQRLKLRRKPRVVTTTSIQSPAVFGLFRPILLMPVGYLRKLSRKDTEYMLLHELAHIKRGDLIAHSVYMLLQVVYWYNPMLWLVRRKLRLLRELCCDATVASLLRDKTVEYRQTLLETARRFLATPVEPGLGLVGLFEDSNRLIARIQWLKKPVWRYRKMKSIAVITTILILLACVLPMAQANNPQPEDVNVSSGQTEEKSTQSEEMLETEQKKKEDQQKQLQALQLLKEEQQKQLETMQLLMARLKQIEVEKQKLQKELQALMQTQGDATAASMEAKLAKDNAAQASMKAKEAKDKALKATMKAQEAKDKASKIKAQTEMNKDDVELQIELQKAEDEAMKADQVAKKAYAELRKAEDEVKHWEHLKNKTHEKTEVNLVIPTPIPNPTPRPMPVMAPIPVEVDVDTDIDVEVVEPEVEMDVEIEVTDTPEVSEIVVPIPPTPSITIPTPPAPPRVVAPTPPIAPSPPGVAIAATPVAPAPVPAPPTPPRVVAPVPPASPTPPSVIVPATPAAPVMSITPPTPPTPVHVEAPAPITPSSTNLPLLGTPAEAVIPAPAVSPKPRPKPNRDIKIGRTKDGKFFAITEMHLVSKVNPGSPFVIRNSLGNIILKQSKDDTCDVKAVVRAEAETAEEAQEMAEQVGMQIDTSKEKYYLKPVKPDDNQWSNLSVNLTILVPLGVRPDVKTELGNVELWNLRGKIKAVSDLGSVKAVNTSGDLELLSKMGEIVFCPPKDLSAKLRAETKMGSIKSDLPLTINKNDMFKRTAEGTIGSGRDTIRMTTNMGSIHITNKPPKLSDNDPEPMIPGDDLRVSADKLKTQQIQLEAMASKIAGTVQSIKEEQEGNRSVLKRVETTTAPLLPGSVLDIKNEDGNVTVRGSDTDQCSITSTFTIKAPSMEEARDLSEKIALETTPGDKKLTVKIVGPRQTPSNHTYYVDLQINVPRNTTVTMHKEDGNVRIHNVEGLIQIGSEDGEITCENVVGDVRLVCEDGNAKIEKSRVDNLTIRKEDGNIHCDSISGNCDIAIEDGNVTIGYAEGSDENCTCIVRGEDGNVTISRGAFAKCQVNRESGNIRCDNIRGNLDFKLEEGQVTMHYADSVPESCSIIAQLEEGSIKLSAPGEMFPADGPSKAKKKDEGMEWKTTAGNRTVSLRVDEGSIKVEKR